MFKLSMSSVDDDNVEKTFGSMDEAIEHARQWFLDGYDNETIDGAGLQMAKGYADEIESCLRRGETFHCGLFHETITLTEAVSG